jgi:hypothetical protein
MVEYEPLESQDYVTCEEMPMWILDHKKQMLCTRKIRIVKVLWQNHEVLRGIMVGGTRYKKPLSTLVRGS